MALHAIQDALERPRKRWILGALALALLLHLLAAYFFEQYRIARLATPSSRLPVPGPFSLKRIEIRADALRSTPSNLAAQLPHPEPPRNPAQFNLDPRQVEKALQTPQPSLSVPSVPEPGRVIAATDLGRTLPYAESDNAALTAEIARTQPAAVTGGPVTSSKLAQDLISAMPGPAQAGVSSGTAPTSSGADPSSLPGFAQLAPGLQPSGPDLSKLPEPVLLRLSSDVLFDFDSAQLKPEADGLLGQALAMITQNPQADIQVDGYSDSIGRADYNVALSRQRAQAVQAWLQRHAPPGAYRFRAEGHGAANFVVSPQGTIEQQQPNRRVEIVIQALKAPASSAGG